MITAVHGFIVNGIHISSTWMHGLLVAVVHWTLDLLIAIGLTAQHAEGLMVIAFVVVLCAPRRQQRKLGRHVSHFGKGAVHLVVVTMALGLVRFLAGVAIDVLCAVMFEWPAKIVPALFARTIAAGRSIRRRYVAQQRMKEWIASPDAQTLETAPHLQELARHEVDLI